MNRELKTFNSSLFPLWKYIYFKWLSFKTLSFTRKWWFCLVLIRMFRQTLPDSLWSCLSQLSKLLVVFPFLWNHWLAFIRIHLPYSYLAIPMLLKSQNLPDWKSPEWVYCPNLNAPSFFILLLHWSHCCSPKWQLYGASGKGEKKKMQQTVSENQMENAFSFRMWSILHIHILLLLLSDFLTWRNLRWFFFLQRFCVFVFLNKSIWCGNIKHLAASMSYCWPYFFA